MKSLDFNNQILIFTPMGIYTYLTESDRKRWKECQEDEYVNEEFQEALKYDPSLLITSHLQIVKRKLFGKDIIERRFTIYHDVNYKNPPYQAREQMSASGEKKVVIAYLHGIINASTNKN